MPSLPSVSEALAGVLSRGLQQRVSPGFQWAYARLQDRHIVEGCAGRLSYEETAPQVTTETVYDLASLTKVLTALTAVRMAEAGRVVLGGALGPGVGGPLGRLGLGALLSHRAGLAAWAPLYQSVGGATGAEAWDRALEALEAAPRSPDEAPTAAYSDLGYILAGRSLELGSGLSLDALVAREVTGPLGLTKALRFRGTGPTWRDPGVAPTEDCPWRGRVVQGEVHDENAYALGGVAGHAGMFGTAGALATLGRTMLAALAGESSWLSADAARTMLAPQPGGTHRLGWDGKSPTGASAGARMSPSTFGHLGFTGTSLWCDPAAGVAVALVSNRVHPRRDNLGIRALRPAFHDALMDALGRA